MDFKLPELGEGVYEAEAVRWLVKPGDAVKPGQTLLEVLTDKATMEVPAPFAGVVSKLLVQTGDKLEIGQAILQFDGKEGKDKPRDERSDSRGSRDNGPPTVAPAVRGATSEGTTVKAAPAVRQMARKLGIDLAAIRGSGPAGRILIDDLANKVKKVSGPFSQEKGPDTFYGKAGTRIAFAGVRRKIAEHMVASKHAIPHFAYVDECDVTDLVKLRDMLKEPFAIKGVKLTYLAFFVKAAAAALKDVPIVNASLDEKAGEIVLHHRYHIGIAVATPAGLIMPVVRDADRKSLLDVAREIERLSNEARLGKQRLEDLQGATFAVTSVGNIGGLFSTPIIPPSLVGILGLGKIVKRPIFDERGQVIAADMIYLSFSFDHRVLDGAVGAAFGNAVIEHLRQAAAMLL